MSSFGQGCRLRLSASMMVPAGSAFLATRIFGPTGTIGAAAACCAPAPANMFLAITAVTTAMTSAPMSSATFFTSMAKSPPPCGPLEQPQTSGKLVKKALGENRSEHGDPAERDRDSVRNLGPALSPLDPMPHQNPECEHAASNRHHDQESDRENRREPQRECCRELDVTPAHHAGAK